jgi:hypothetical protein
MMGTRIFFFIMRPLRFPDSKPLDVKSNVFKGVGVRLLFLLGPVF